MASGNCRKTIIDPSTIFVRCALKESSMLHDVGLKAIFPDDMFFRPVYMLFISSLSTLML